MGWEDTAPKSWEDSTVKQKVASDQTPSIELPPHVQAPGFLLASPAGDLPRPQSSSEALHCVVLWLGVLLCLMFLYGAITVH